MSMCRVCGDERTARYRVRSRMVLCDACHKDTPAKVARAEFERLFWDGLADNVALAVRNEFWDDYRASSYGPVADYKAATTATPW
jgi:hypothetical protein